MSVEHTMLARRLIELGHVTAEQMSMAETERRRSGDSLTKVLRSLRLVAEEDVAKVSASILGLRYITPRLTDVDIQKVSQLRLEFLKEHALLPLVIDGDHASVVMADPSDVDATDTFARLIGEEPRLYVTTESIIRELLGEITQRGRSLTNDIESTVRAATAIATQKSDAIDTAEAAPVVRLVDELLMLAIQQRATDLHLEPEEKIIRVRLRIDGMLEQGPMLPKELQAGLTTRLKVMSDLNISEKRLPQDGRIQLRREDREYDLRVSILPTVHGENVVLRILDKSSLPMNLERLGMARDTLGDLREVLTNPYGVFLATGPTGSGKSTTLYASLGLLDAMRTKIVTVEDPIEYQFPLIRQCQVNPRSGLTFAEGLRSILRQDPDTILVGEIRDLETAQIAIRAGLTGHLVLSTLHTNAATGAIPRLVDMGLEPYMVSSSLLGVLAQRLVRRLCPECRRPSKPNDREKALLESQGVEGEVLYRAEGCESCRRTGYEGRTGIHELFVPGKEARELCAQGVGEERLAEAAQNQGMRRLLKDGLQKTVDGTTSVDEVLRVVRSLEEKQGS